MSHLAAPGLPGLSLSDMLRLVTLRKIDHGVCLTHNRNDNTLGRKVDLYGRIIVKQKSVNVRRQMGRGARLEPQLLDDGVRLAEQRAQARVLGVLRQPQVLPVIVLAQRRHARRRLGPHPPRLPACARSSECRKGDRG